jgi:predicted amidohydrolase
VRITIAQLRVEPDIARNAERMLAVIRDARPGDWIAFPEGMLSGYFPERDTFVRELDADAIDRRIRDIGADVRRVGCHCIFGAVTKRDGAWHNAVIIQSAAAASSEYDKVELSRLDRCHFTPGAAAGVYAVGEVRIGVQACRELLFPARWMTLKAQGAQVVFHINNAVKPHDDVWRHVLIARAIENSVFVCSVNNAAPPQRLASYLIDPSGRVLAESTPQTDQVMTCDIDLGAVIQTLAERSDF